MADKDWKIEFPVNKGMKSYLASFLSEIEQEPQIAERIRLGKLQEADLPIRFFHLTYDQSWDRELLQKAVCKDP